MTNIDLVTSTHRHNLIIYEFIHNLRTTPPTPAITYLILYSFIHAQTVATDLIIYSFIHAQAVASTAPR